MSKTNKYIYKDMFAEMGDKLEHLILDNYDIVTIENHAFAPLSNLEYLSLKGNNLRHVPCMAWANHNSALLTITMSNSHVQYVSKKWFLDLHMSQKYD